MLGTIDPIQIHLLQNVYFPPLRPKVAQTTSNLHISPPVHYGFCPLVKLTFKDLAKLTAFAAIFKTKSYFR